MATLAEDLLRLVKGRAGHFAMESGYHSDHWCELDRLFDDKRALAPFVSELARRLRPYNVEIVVGPETGGATLAQMVAVELGLKSVSAGRIAPASATGLFPVRYEVPQGQRSGLMGRRVTIVDDAISAGSAVRGTLNNLLECGARPVALGALLIFGETAESWARERRLPLEAVARRGLGMWQPAGCPLCRAGQAVENVG